MIGKKRDASLTLKYSQSSAQLTRPWWYPGYFLLSTIALGCYWLRSLVASGKRATFRARCASTSSATVLPLWLHGASLGEVQGLSPVIDALLIQQPQLPLLVTTTSLTGQKSVGEKFPNVARSLLPFDHPWIVRRWLAQVRPRAMVIAETELWPALFVEAGAQGVPIFIINGRISERAFPRYRWLRFMLADLFQRVVWLGAMSDSDRDRYLALGMSALRLQVSGSTKFDQQFAVIGGTAANQLRNESGLTAAKQVLVAGSVRPGEDEIVLQAFIAAQKKLPGLALVLAPRHPDKSGHLDALLQQLHLSFRRRSQVNLDFQSPTMPSPVNVLILDTLGELQSFYQIADVVFVGGTLVPIGGHNPFEAIAFKRPVIVGPWTQNVKDAIKLLHDAAGIVEVANAAQLEQAIVKILLDTLFRQALVENAEQVLTKQRGAVVRVIEALETAYA